MSHAATRPTGHVLFSVALASLLGAVLVPFQAGAQIPSVRRRVQDAARAVEQPKPQCQAVAFDSVVQELTAARLEQVMKGLRARHRVMDGQRGAPSWNALVSRRDAAANAAADLVNRKGPEMDAYRESKTRVDQCREEAFNERRQANRQANMQRAMSDPDFMRQTAELAQRVVEAQQRGDTAEVIRLNQQAAALLEGPTRADTIAVDRHCGRPPTPPASIAQLDSLRALEDSLNAQLRRREQEADTIAVTASGLTSRQMAMGQERAEMFLSKVAAEGTMCGFSEAEVVALKARRPELEELL